MRVKELFAFIKARHDIWEAREKGLPKPWTKDTILQQYRFCNVYRELDTVTQHFRFGRWYQDLHNNEDLWFAALVFRYVNLPETIDELSNPVPWLESKASEFRLTLQERKRLGKQVYNGAYIVSTNGVKMQKHLYLANIFTEIWSLRKDIRWRGAAKDSLDKMHERLMNLNGVGSFMAAQVIADIKYAPIMRKEAHDWWSFAASGPGSRRGMNRLLGYADYESHWNEKAWRIKLGELQVKIDPMAKTAWMPRLHAQDLQNCLCEYDKYERVRLGQGKPKARYSGVK